MTKKLMKMLILCVLLTSLSTSLVKAETTTLSALPNSTFDSVSFATRFLGSVCNISSFVTTPHLENSPNASEQNVGATVSNEYGEFDVSVNFINDTFLYYEASFLSGTYDNKSELGSTDLLNELIGIVHSCSQFFSANYWNDFSQLLSTAQQTQELATENQNFSLSLPDYTQGSPAYITTLYEKINGNYTCPQVMVGLSLLSDGFLSSIEDNLPFYHVVTTNIISQEQAIDIADSRLNSFAEEYNVDVSDVNATLLYSANPYLIRNDSYGPFGIYPLWSVHATFDKEIPELNADSWSAIMWADTGVLITQGPDTASLGIEPNSNAFSSLPLLLIASIFVFITCIGFYMQRKKRRR